jgi:hypothetical protein
MGGEWQNAGEKWDPTQTSDRLNEDERNAMGVAGAVDVLRLLSQIGRDPSTPPGAGGGFLDAISGLMQGAAQADAKRYGVVEKLAQDPAAVNFLADKFCAPGEPRPQTPDEARAFLRDKMIGDNRHPGMFAYMDQQTFDKWAQDPDKYVHSLKIMEQVAQNPQLVQAMARSEHMPYASQADQVRFLTQKVLPELANAGDTELQQWEANPAKMSQRFIDQNTIMDKFSQTPAAMEEICKRLGQPVPPQVQSREFLEQCLKPYLRQESDQNFQSLLDYANNPLMNNALMPHMYFPNI